jgi:hypothetical protein
MAFIHGKSTTFLHNTVNLSAFFNDAGANRTVETAETTAFGDSSKTYIVGLQDGTISASGMWDNTALVGSDVVLNTALGVADAEITIVPGASPAAGTRCISAMVDSTSYDVTTPIGDVAAISADFQADGGIDSGLCLSALAAVTATANGTAQDHGAATTNGGAAYLHATANTHNGTSIIKIQHSADNVSYADLATFSTVAASTTSSQVAVVAAGTTVQRYVRAVWTLAGSSGGITNLVTFARR